MSFFCPSCLYFVLHVSIFCPSCLYFRSLISPLSVFLVCLFSPNVAPLVLSSIDPPDTSPQPSLPHIIPARARGKHCALPPALFFPANIERLAPAKSLPLHTSTPPVKACLSEPQAQCRSSPCSRRHPLVPPFPNPRFLCTLPALFSGAPGAGLVLLRNLVWVPPTIYSPHSCHVLRAAGPSKRRLDRHPVPGLACLPVFCLDCG
ncbi:hypothetical protein METBIDRAFT_226805 [Metschnikowia bicuspidata var. bicuspidata NRRL YB-4993]|uniref:Uncharacterized protein n=1 Tax=Metschnikowia bicuspidata var. bicuspidata NRRL YB-4993 TaxID=869754 RepID=A0A1A0H236_9ASCO|nr:hypothetical protein METBIDRAFT_226805 [Metschnikowia bicuspidata var. bicuspidata NRRL YB-4993]OBA18018.1 hypothetical protein METBIDRAFT_226805 [Metschnikowia bicuspidata var. bicuspidata NRRL YB-4993]